MKRIIFIALPLFLLTSCHESIEERAAREVKEYTEKQCPTPVVNYTRTDSVTYTKETRTINNYYTLVGKGDNEAAIKENISKFHNVMIRAVIDDPSLRNYKDAKFNFRFVYYSESQHGKVLYEDVIRPEEYNKANKNSIGTGI